MPKNNNDRGGKASPSLNGVASKKGAATSSLPSPSFSALIMSIASTAMMKMGLSGSNNSGSNNKGGKKDLQISQYNIDLLDLLREKTKNNLSQEEQELLAKLSSDLKLQFVQASQQTERTAKTSEDGKTTSPSSTTSPDMAERVKTPDGRQSP